MAVEQSLIDINAFFDADSEDDDWKPPGLVFKNNDVVCELVQQRKVIKDPGELDRQLYFRVPVQPPNPVQETIAKAFDYFSSPLGEDWRGHARKLPPLPNSLYEDSLIEWAQLGRQSEEPERVIEELKSELQSQRTKQEQIKLELQSRANDYDALVADLEHAQHELREGQQRYESSIDRIKAPVVEYLQALIRSFRVVFTTAAISLVIALFSGIDFAVSVVSGSSAMGPLLAIFLGLIALSCFALSLASGLASLRNLGSLVDDLGRLKTHI